jgi:hypothetical protein
MNYIYLVPAAVLEGAVLGEHHALACPTAPTMRLVVVTQWLSDAAQDTFEAYPGVVPLHPWDGAKPAPAALVAAFADAKVASLSGVDTVTSALWKICAGWPVARY